MYILWGLSDDNISNPSMDKVVDHLVDKLTDPIDNLNTAISSAKNFWEATTQQQASELISLQESLKQQADLDKSFNETVEKSQQQQLHLTPVA